MSVAREGTIPPAEDRPGPRSFSFCTAPLSTEARFLEIVSGRKRGLAAGVARGALAAAEPFYVAATRLRNFAYDHGWKRVHTAGAPVVSVGNLTTGGTGKTPVVAAIVAEIQRLGLHPGIASRGYHAIDEAGNDERRVLELQCPGVPHRQDRDRVAAARRLVNGDRCEVVVLDDGFQHRRLARDVDVVLIDATAPWGFGHLLPRGLLREPTSGLSRADLVLITRVDQVDAEELDSIERKIRRHTDVPVALSRFAPTRLLAVDGAASAISTASGLRALAFCGIGNPGAFLRTVQLIGAQLDESSLVAFPDHHAYTPEDLLRIGRRAVESKADLILCTTKDLVKLPRELPEGPPLRAVEIGTEFPRGWAEIAAKLQQGVTHRR